MSKVTNGNKLPSMAEVFKNHPQPEVLLVSVCVSELIHSTFLPTPAPKLSNISKRRSPTRLLGFKNSSPRSQTHLRLSGRVTRNSPPTLSPGCINPMIPPSQRLSRIQSSFQIRLSDPRVSRRRWTMEWRRCRRRKGWVKGYDRECTGLKCLRGMISKTK
jgi:hypothetical protein